jgi:hypothetical protein
MTVGNQRADGHFFCGKAPTITQQFGHYVLFRSRAYPLRSFYAPHQPIIYKEDDLAVFYSALPASPIDTTMLPRARIAVTRPAFLKGDFLFELIVVDGPRSGQCLARVEVKNTKALEVTRRYRPTTPEASRTRQSFRAIGTQAGFSVTDF